MDKQKRAEAWEGAQPGDGARAAAAAGQGSPQAAGTGPQAVTGVVREAWPRGARTADGAKPPAVAGPQAGGPTVAGAAGDAEALSTADVDLRLARGVERLLRFAQQARLLEPLDVYAARNGLLHMLGVAEPYAGELPEERLDSAAGLLTELLDAAHAKGLLPANTTTQRDLFDTALMGLLLGRPSEVVSRFWSLAHQQGAEAATSYLYKLSIDSNYIRMDRIRRNPQWLTPTEYGDLEITVNLSRPEKDPQEIALLKTLAPSSYPACLLCADNIGYAGRLDHPARQNLRVIPLELDGEGWFLQYSPYVYYNEHSIVFHESHIPMKMNSATFRRLLDFVDRFPHYFIGSNADLPIVGGSILNHEHYQAGRHTFPMELAASEAVFTHVAYPGTKAAIIKWPMSVLRISGHDRSALLALAYRLLADWQSYSDPAAEILAFTKQPDGTKTPHNTITPIARRNKRGEYEIDLVLRNNRTNAAYPGGIFHPHEHLHHIKKENIGLIEVMGLAVLPGRLQEELATIATLLSGGAGYDRAAVSRDNRHPLFKHALWIEELLTQYGWRLSPDQAAKALQQAVGRKFLAVLEDAGVFKRTASGQAAFGRFLAAGGFRKLH
ncbi:UDP-glucose--hexose-1-phosphate uridylyltransferase [Paenibacillus athensensis]|uniref:Galactose-1-phosphate uridylyltransferase n=1 Tax=Paenibacillus athensensis TaxID=1967502 RepID=A0A4Y8Q9D8_9BACL|nr:UDP-glucose--hexose-1-phosphate uridylyltransferase [Paenibacillus athensensis]MCD1260047.1 UDP-glucose--hexose-1-phosphate uridylyltransferase [Paenibacillus athensensis]